MVGLRQLHTVLHDACCLAVQHNAILSDCDLVYDRLFCDCHDIFLLVNEVRPDNPIWLIKLCMLQNIEYKKSRLYLKHQDTMNRMT